MFSALINDVSLGRRQALAAMLGAGLGIGLRGTAAEVVRPGSLGLGNPVDNLYAFPR